jgi:hypothetical protein
MNNKTSWIASAFLASSIFATVGCGQGLKSTSPGRTVAEHQANVDKQMDQAEKAAADAQDALVAAQTVLAQISDANGNFNLGLFSGLKGKMSLGNILGPVADKLTEVFDQVYEKLALLKTKYGEARLALADAMGKLDASDPTQAKLIAQINSQMGRLDDLEKQYTSAIHKLARKLDLVERSIDKLVSGVTSSIPGFGAILGLALDYLVLDDIYAVIDGFQQKLLDL